MNQEWSLGCPSDPVNAQHVIKVRMRRDNTGRRGVDIFDELQNSLRLIAWVYNNGLATRLQNVAVSL
jgi:hypothetical protein